MDNRILVVDDDASSRRLMVKYLTDAGLEILEAENGKDALTLILDQAPPIIVTDWNMPQMDGIELCRALRSHEGVRFAYILLVTSQDDTESLVRAFDAGADDFIPKPLNRLELLARIRAGQRIARLEGDFARHSREILQLNAEAAVVNKKLELANTKLQKMATIDYLTGLPNRREAINRLQEHWVTWLRYQTPLSCVMIDIDHFKKLNDSYGHATGDNVLAATAEIIARGIRASDIACRIGGEEFLIICPHSDLAGATQCAEHIREIVARHEFQVPGGTHHVTISLGVADAAIGPESPAQLMEMADSALYESKKNGRNRVTPATTASTAMAS